MASSKAGAQHSRLLRPLVMTAVSFSVAGILLLFAGRWNWLEGWLLAGLFGALLIGSGIWTELYAPDLSEERMQAIAHPGSRHERLILVWIPMLIVVTLIVAALDGGRFSWSTVPPWIKMFGFGLFAAYALLNMWAAASNRFLSAAVRVQEDREHTVVETGPYRRIRHPMYLGLCFMGIGVPLALGSWWALIPGCLFSLTFVYRTAQEDRFLRANLPGYEAYARRTPYRLIPGVW